jgi:integrase
MQLIIWLLLLLASPGSVYKRGKTWTAHLRWRGGQWKKGGFRTKREAEDALVETVNQVRSHQHVATGKLTFGKYLETWLSSLLVAGRRETTVASYRRLVDTHIAPKLGPIVMRDLKALDLDELYAEVADKGRKPRTVRFVHSVCHKALHDAQRKGLVPVNVAAQASPPKSSACRAPEVKVWTPAQLHVFLDQTAGHHHGAIIRLAAMSGLRRGELCGLRWCDVDLDAATVAVRQTITTVNHRPVVGPVKTTQGRRVVDLDPTTVTVLRRQRKAQLELQVLAGPLWKDTGLVFTMPDGSGWNPDSISQAVRRLIEASGLPRIALHGLRHSHLSQWVDAGEDPKLVSTRAGHASVAFTLDTYVHSMPGRQAEAASKIAALIDSADAVEKSGTKRLPNRPQGLPGRLPPA